MNSMEIVFRLGDKMFGINNITDIIIIILFIEVILIMIVLFRLQSKTKQHERDINTLSVKSRECERHMESFQKRTNLLEQSVFMQEVRNAKSLKNK